MRLLSVRSSGIALTAVVLTAAGVWLLTSGELPAQAPKGGKGEPKAPPRVLVDTARGATIAEPRTFVGTVKPTRRSLVGSAVDGRVIEFPGTEGTWVEKGQPLCQLLTGTIAIEVAVANAELRLRQQEFQEMQNGSRPEEIASAKAKLEEARAVMVFTRDKLQRAEKLFQSNAASSEHLNEAQSQATAGAQLLIAAQANYEMAAKGPREEKVRQAQARVEVAQEQVNLLNDRLEKYTIKAPFDGWVSVEHTEVGQWVMRGDPVAEFVELTEVDVEIAVVEDFIGNLNTTVEGLVEVPALPGQPFTGRVSMINPQADARARTFPVKVRVPNHIQNNVPLLKAGMFARVTLPVGKPTACVLVPKDALKLGGASPIVYVVSTAGGKSNVNPVPVKLGPAQGAWIAAFGELKEGDSVVVEGNERLQPGQEIRAEKKAVAYP